MSGRYSARGVDKEPGWVERRFREQDQRLAELSTGKLSAVPGSVVTIQQILTDPAAVVGFENVDTATASADGSSVLIPLTHVPRPGSLHVRQNGLDLAVDEWAWSGYLVTVAASAEVIIRTGDVFTAAYAYDGLVDSTNTENQYVAAVLADAPILYAKLDDADAVAADASGNERHGAYGGTVTVGADTLAPGLPGTSVDFTDGGWAEFSPGAAWQRTAPFTVELWFQLDNQHITEAAVLAACDDAGTADSDRVWDLSIPSAGSTNSIEALAFTGTTTVEAAETAEISVGTTYYLTMDFDGTSLRLFVDNTLIDVGTMSGSINTSTLWPLTLGKTADGQFGRFGETYGRIQHFALYDKVLADDRRTAHYTIGVGE